MKRDPWLALVPLFVLSAWAAMLLLSACAHMPSRPPKAQSVLDATAAQWRDEGLPWTARCGRAMRRLSVDTDVGRCRPPAHGCLEAYRDAIHLEPGYTPSLLVHEIWHALHRCSGVHAIGDPKHASGLWRTPKVPPALDDRAEARAVMRAGDNR